MKKYLFLADKINAINQQFSLKPNEIELLDAIAKSHVVNEVIIVRDLIYDKPIASPATLHALLKSLVRKRLITMKEDKLDARRKLVNLTKLALDRYKRLELLMGA